MSVFHYVLGGFQALGGCFALIYVALGVAMLTGSFNEPGNAENPPEELGWIFVAIGGGIALLVWGIAISLILAGRRLSQRTHHTYCTIVAAIECLSFPLGTVLGVFTLIVLSRPSVKELFEATAEGWRDGFEE